MSEQLLWLIAFVLWLPATFSIGFCVALKLVGYGVRGGMTLRDYFAGQALTGMLASPHWDRQVDQSANPDDPWAHAARASYAFADALLKARCRK